MDDDAQASNEGAALPAPRYCTICGGVFAESGDDRCPRCGARWTPRTFADVASLATLLTELRSLHEDGLIDEASYRAARTLYERRLLSVRPSVDDAVPVRRGPSRTSVGGLLRRALDPRGEAEREAPSPRMPSPPVRPPRPTLGEWAATRQADILLYLGAFILSIAALIFVSYQGDTVTSGVRVGVLVLYTLAFLGLGLLLPRWDRVREAGPVFLALGAILVPVCFVAVRVQLLDDSTVPEDVLWLTGASATGALYLLLAARGFGRLYALPGALALLVAWGALGAVVDLPEEWFGTWFAGLAAVLLVVVEVRSPPGREWIERGGAVVAGLGLLLAHAFAAGSEGSAIALPGAYLLVTAAVVYSVTQRTRPETLVLMPPLIGMTLLTAWWAALGLEPRWWCVFIAGATLGYLLIAEWDRPRTDRWRTAAAIAAALALVAAFGFADHGWQRPVAAGLLLAGAGWSAHRGRTAETLTLPVLGALTAIAVLEAAEIDPVWWSYPALAAAMLILLARPWWQRQERLRAIGWPYLLLVAVAVPLGFTRLYADEPAHGVAGFVVAALIVLAAALETRGALSRLMLRRETERSSTIERQMLARASGLLLYAAAGYLNARLGLVDSERAWVYAAIGSAMWLGLAVFGGARRELFGILAPGGVLAMIVAGTLAWNDRAVAAAVLALAAAAPLPALRSTRRPLLWVVAATFGTAALIAAWEWRDLDRSLLPLALAAIAATLMAVLTPTRTYSLNERGWSVTLLTWGPWLSAVAVAGALLAQRESGLAPGEALPRTREWAVFAIAVAAAALSVVLEGVRIGRKGVAVAGTSGIMLAGLLAIAIAQPENVQAYTLPAGLYLIASGFLWRRSPALIPPHLFSHEALMIAGMLVLLLPAAEQSFAPDGGRFGLELIGAGLVLLAAGLTLSARWLVVGGVISLTAVAVRWLIGESAVPYWLTLGLAGMALLGFGMLLLLERDRWDRARERLGRWWQGGSTPMPSP